MIILFLLIIGALSVYEIWNFKKKYQFKDIIVYSVSMVIVAAFGIIFLLNTSQPSIVSYIFNILG